VALKQLQIVLRDKLVERAAALGKHMRPLLDRLKDDFEPIGDVRGMALYQMLDIVTDRKSRKPDFAMAERIRYYAALEGVIIICVKNFIRICPPLIITEAQIDDMIGRLRKAIERAQSDTGRKVELRQSSSLAAGVTGGLALPVHHPRRRALSVVWTPRFLHSCQFLIQTGSDRLDQEF
jgi:hypothetical protein